MRRLLNQLLFLAVLTTALSSAQSAAAAQEKKTAEQIRNERRFLYDQVSAVTGVPWYAIAAIDQYERSLTIARPKYRSNTSDLIGIYYSPSEWAGALNPDANDTDPVSIAFFQGVGKDGDGDGKADRNNDADVLYTRTLHILKHGTAPSDFKKGLWDYYQNARSVQRVSQFAKIYAHFDTLHLTDNVFPLPLRSDYSYRSTWGARRSWGGYRIHEGTDVFAGYGVPVRSTCYGLIEVMGWNRFGGWRIGIRDLNNVYHYYAHLSGFNKQFKAGDIVEPGQVVGWVGSSGYGKPGTQGKFPPHLHYGLYRDAGLVDWAFDPYPLLRKWERQEYARRRK